MDEPAWKILLDRARARLDPVWARLSERPVAVLGAALAVAGAVVGAWLVLRPPPAAPEAALPRATTSATASSAGSADSSTSATGRVATTTTADTATVDVVGAVARPGLVTVPAGSRVADAVAAAGGASASADLVRLNLAAPVADGERIYVPQVGETSIPTAVNGTGAPAAGTADASDTTAPVAPVDLNQATEQQLETLPGVGPATAQAILDYRRQHGPFRSVDGLLQVRGIGPAKLAALRQRVHV